MTTHLSSKDIADYLAQACAPEDLLRVDDHLAECSACRGRFEVTERVSASVAELRQSFRTFAMEHPSHDQVIAYMDATADEADCEAIEVHLGMCDTCREDLEDLQNLQPSFATVQQPKETLSLRSMVRALGRISGLSPKDRERITSALSSGRLNIPPAILALGGATGTLLGPEGAPAFAPLHPVGTAVEGPCPVFEWASLPDARSYVVSVFDEHFEKIAESEPLNSLRWTPDRPFERDREYLWQIRARNSDAEVTSPAPPAPEARFRILAEFEADHVAAIRGTYAESSLALGVLFAEAGLLDDAEVQLENLAAANPSSEEVRQLLDNIHRERRGATKNRPR